MLKMVALELDAPVCACDDPQHVWSIKTAKGWSMELHCKSCKQGLVVAWDKLPWTIRVNRPGGKQAEPASSSVSSQPQPPPVPARPAQSRPTFDGKHDGRGTVPPLLKR